MIQKSNPLGGGGDPPKKDRASVAKSLANAFRSLKRYVPPKSK